MSVGNPRKRTGPGLLELAIVPAWVIVLLWLFNQTQYRETLRALVTRKPGMLDVFWYSPQLLHGGSAYQVALFFWLWVPLVLFVAYPVRVLIRRKRIAAAGEGR